MHANETDKALSAGLLHDPGCEYPVWLASRAALQGIVSRHSPFILWPGEGNRSGSSGVLFFLLSLLRPIPAAEAVVEGDGCMLELQAFGPLTLRGASGLTQPKRLALLTYLVLARPRGFQRRDTLLAIFWPELDQTRGRKALSQALFFLRNALPERVLFSRGTEEVGVDFHRIRCDVIHFEAALEQRRWAKAVDLYGGELLAGFHLAQTSGFEDWLIFERERLREMAAEAAWSEAMGRLKAGEAVQAERVAGKAIYLAPTQEGPVRMFIEALARAGDRAAALRFYEKYVEVLDRALEVDPAPETAALAEGLRRTGGRYGGLQAPGPPAGNSIGPTGKEPEDSRAPDIIAGERLLRSTGQPPTKHAQAHALFRKGMAAFESGLPEDYARGLSRFEAALRLDPDYARAHAGMALLLAAYPTVTYRVPPDHATRLREAAARALELDPGSGHAWAARGYHLWTREREWLRAEEALTRALGLHFDDPHILLLAAEYYRMLGRLDEATDCLDQLEGLGLELSYGQVLRAGIELSRAEHGEISPEVPVQRLRSVIHREPSDGLAHLWLAIALAQTDQQDEMLASVDTSLRINPEIPLAHGFRGAILARLGRRRKALEEEAWFQAEEEGSPRDRFSWGFLRLALGDLDGGFRLMEEGVRRYPSFLLPGFRLMLYFRRFWDDPRFAAIMEGLWPGAQKKVLGPYGWQPSRGS